MSLDLLGDGFELHGGGADLMFPHHENERAQAVATDREFARHWMHNGWVTIDGEKMSKSLGNFTSLTDLLDRSDARSYRLLVLRSHYRSPIEVTPETIADAESGLARLDEMARRFAPRGPAGRRPGGRSRCVRGVGGGRVRRRGGGPVPRPDGRRPRHPRGPGHRLRPGPPGQRCRRRRGRRRGGRGRRARRRCLPQPSDCASGPPRRSTSIRPPPTWSGAGTRPGPHATGTRPTRSVAGWRPPAGWSRTGPRAPASAVNERRVNSRSRRASPS